MQPLIMQHQEQASRSLQLTLKTALNMQRQPIFIFVHMMEVMTM